MIDLLIDRVGNVNVFNILFDGETYAESHLQSVMDEDLIFEYIKEIENLSKVSQALHSNIGDTTRFRPDILKELKILGETFFLQFFPAQVAEKLRMTNQKYLHFNIDQGLSDIPWELLHNGECFLSDKFYIGKTVKGAYRSNSPIEKDKLRMLIIIDPTEDLEWAEKEGEELFKTLKSKISPSKLDISFIGGKQITKLKLLSLIKDKHIIHYSGHLYFSDEPLENGWLLSNGKVLKAREIKNCGFSTDLVFSNSCDSSKNVRYNNSHGIMNYFAGSFLMSGIKCFIGTNWEIIDNQKTLDFTIRFYLSLLNDRSIGESLFTAKEYARRNYESWDLTWANYSLHGPPSYIIINKPEKNIQKIINPNSIINFYPTPVARSYKEFLDLEMEESGHQKAMEAVINCFEDYSRLIGIIVFSNHRFQSLGNNNPFEFKLKTWWEQIYQCIWDFKKLEISMFMDSFMKILYSNRDVINKMVD
ncbi:MAG: CHAT domain-containing protein, partial [Leptospiraceae bacterium]|nr:CHAT domain-containing protein [Leptospiraceae bacterium]